ncbi:MAG: tetratricopeptide repeat protein [Candidatus Riflebacteria bacterium]|nr:tetratricopeptide repeat protein [Candidatus Riflebacteria bacterium]
MALSRRFCMFLGLAVALTLPVGQAVAADEYYLANSYFRQGKHQKVLEIIDRLEKSDGAPAVSPALLWIKSQSLASLERPKEAVECLENLLTRFPAATVAGSARLKLAQILDEQKNYRALIEKLRGWTGFDGAEGQFTKLLARTLVLDGKTDQAIELLKGSTRHLDMLFEVLSESKRLDGFLAQEEKAFDGSPEASLRLGMLYGSKRDWPRARSYLEKCLRARPADVVLLNRMTALARESRDLASAVRYTRGLVTAEPENSGHLKRLGDLQLQLGQKVEALATWNQIRARASDDRQAHQLYVSILADHDLVPEAISAVEGARKLFSAPTLFAEEMGQLWAKKGDPESAAREYLTVVSRGGDKGRDLLLALAGVDRTRLTAALPGTRPSVAYEACVKAVLAAISVRPTVLELYYLLDDLYQLHPDQAKILDLARLLARNLATDTEQVLRAAKDFSAEGRVLEARFIYREVIPRLPVPESGDVALELARLERQAGESKSALELLKKLRAPAIPDPVDVAARTLAAEITLEDLKDHATAKKLLDEAASRYPTAREQARWSYLLARCALARLDFKEATGILTRLEAEADNPLGPEVLYQLALLELVGNRLEAGRERLQLLVLKRPSSHVANDALRELFFLATHKEDEKPFLTAEYYCQRLAVEMGRFDEYDRRVASIDPSKMPPAFKPDFMFLSARALRVRGQPQKAIEVLTQLLKSTPEGPVHEESLLLSADICEKDLKDTSRAKTVLQDFIMLYPRSIRAEDLRRQIEGTGAVPMPTRGVEIPAQ